MNTMDLSNNPDANSRGTPESVMIHDDSAVESLLNLHEPVTSPEKTKVATTRSDTAEEVMLPLSTITIVSENETSTSSSANSSNFMSPSTVTTEKNVVPVARFADDVTFC